MLLQTQLLLPRQRRTGGVNMLVSGDKSKTHFTDRVGAKGPDKEWKSNPCKGDTKLGLGPFLPHQFQPHRVMLEGAENQLTYMDRTFCVTKNDLLDVSWCHSDYLCYRPWSFFLNWHRCPLFFLCHLPWFKYQNKIVRLVWFRKYLVNLIIVDIKIKEIFGYIWFFGEEVWTELTNLSLQFWR